MPMESALILDRYRPLAELGQGGFGAVTLAWDTRMQRRVAIKRLELPLDSHGDPHTPPGLAEARTAAMLSHPEIVTLLDFDTDSDEAFLVMEYVDGAPLSVLLEGLDGPLTPEETAAVVDGVANALDFAHDNGVLHLDIKPENVLVTRSGRIKVADFGLAELSSLTGHGRALGGTPGYMPPEQRGGGSVDTRTDTWALAVLAFECLTASLPFDDDPDPGADEPPAPSELTPGLPPEVDDALLTALSLRPSERYVSAGDLADALVPALGDPDAGRDSLADVVAQYTEDLDDDDASDEATLGLWDRMGGRAGFSFVRVVATVEAVWLAWAGLSPLGLQPVAVAAGSALVALAAALAPSLGMALGLAALTVGLAFSGVWPAALAVGLGGAVWWWFLARTSPGAAILPLAAPVLGVARIPFAQPLIAGFAFRPLPATITGLLGGALAFFSSAATLHGPPYTAVAPTLAIEPWNLAIAANSLEALVASPAAWVAFAGWPLAALFASLGSGSSTRAGAALGMVGAGGTLAAAYVLASRVAAATGEPLPGAWTDTGFVIASAGSLILIGIVVALGAPLRAEE